MYTAEKLTVLGELTVSVRYGEYMGAHTLHVVEGNGPSLGLYISGSYRLES